MEFRVLGPLEIVADDAPVLPGGTRQQIVLSSLLLDANRVVPISRLTDAIYGADVPSTARAQTQICISSLRRLFASHGRPAAILTRSQGYVLQLDHPDLDLYRHDELVQRARAAREANRLDDAVRDYRVALALWRGPALQGLESMALQAAVGTVNERRITVNEDCIEIELCLGLHRDLVGELTELIAAHPLRERLRGQLMLALYRSGRRAEALEAYRAARLSMVEDLGLEPSEWLRQLEYRILVSDTGLRSPAPPPVSAGRPGMAAATRPAPPTEPVAAGPQLLPTDIGDFAGRTDHLAAIRRALTDARDDPDRYAVPVVVVAGRPGVGKTTLVVHAAHRLADMFPDGRLFADLHGRATDPADPARVLDRFLRTLGTPAAGVPASLEQRAEHYRDELAGRRALIVLDDAADEKQVLPLLPGARGSAVLIASRRWLPGIPGAVHIGVDVFEPEHSTELLTAIVGADRVRAEPVVAAELAGLCGHLPLALRIAGARLAARPHWSLRQLADRLADDTRVIGELAHGGTSVWGTLAPAVDALPAPVRRLFRLLGLMDFPAFSDWAGAALLDVPLPEAEDLLDALADAQLLDTVEAGSGLEHQYRFHRLIRAFAREQGRTQEPPEHRRAAVRRALVALSLLAAEAHRRLDGSAQPADPDVRAGLPEALVRRLVDGPLLWFERERTTLIAGIRQAARSGYPDLSLNLAINTARLSASGLHQNTWREAHDFALTAARQLDQRRGQSLPSGDRPYRATLGNLATVEINDLD